jgi:PQQ-dependent catabolism-associated CXXCW motif protein
MAGASRKVWSPPLMPALASAVAGAVLLLSHALAFADEPDFDSATGYRIARYRSPVPDKVAGGTVISAADIASLLKNQKAVLIDVMPSDGAGPDPATGEWRMTKPRQNIPGSIWLPDVGKGELSPVLNAYFRDNLAKLTAGNTGQPVIVYCQADCWMSWNAVQRAATYGYTSLYWYPEGSDGWRDWDGRFADAKPVPLVPTATSDEQGSKP